MAQDYFATKKIISTSRGDFSFYSLLRLQDQGLTKLDKLPFSIRILLESLLRQCNNKEITTEDGRSGCYAFGNGSPGW